MKYKSLEAQVLDERRRREMAQAKLRQTAADVDYIAMMCDVELAMPDADKNSQKAREADGTR